MGPVRHLGFVLWGAALLGSVLLDAIFGMVEEPGGVTGTTLTLGAVGVACVLLGVFPRPRPGDPDLCRAEAAHLLALVVEAETAVLAHLRTDPGFPEPRFRPRGGDGSLPLSDLAGHFDALPRGRMVIVGAEGSGRTVAAVRLVLDLAALAPGRDRFVVPVRLPVGTLPEAGHHSSLDDWILEHLANTYRLPLEVGAELLGEGWVLPIVDGLDELPRRRARRVVDVVDDARQFRDRAAVLVCGSDGLLRLPGDADVVELLPLEVERVAGWLGERFPDGDWDPVIAEIREHPGGATARTLTTPLDLHLAVSAGSPEGLVAAAAAAHPEGERTRRWLRTLGRSSAVDVFALWSTAGVSPGTVVAAATAGVGVAAALWTAVVAVLLLDAPEVPYALVAAPGVGMAAAWISFTRGEPRDVRVSTLGHRGRTGPWAWVLCWGGAGVTYLIGAEDAPTAPDQVITRFLLCGLGGALATYLVYFTPRRRDAALPSTPLSWATADLAARFAAPVVLFCTLNLSAAIGAPDELDQLVASPMVGFLFGGPVGFLVAVAPSPLPRYWAAVALARRADLLPPRLGRFLDWARDAGLLRVTGSATEFRHERIRAHVLSDDGR